MKHAISVEDVATMRYPVRLRQAAGNSKPKRPTKDKAYNVRGSGEEYAFMKENDRNPSGLVNLKVGGVTMTSVVTDSGQHAM